MVVDLLLAPTYSGSLRVARSERSPLRHDDLHTETSEATIDTKRFQNIPVLDECHDREGNG